MAVQQCRVSKQRARTRKAANRYKGIEATKCNTCGAAIQPHRVCKACGTYRGKQVLTITAE